MKQNLFEELLQRKLHLIHLVEKASHFNWINEDRKNEIIDKLNNDTLTIGVIGQMKCGKSTFLNSFIFEDIVLPVATTPMTAALSIITYGEEKKIIAEFYNKDEWEEQKLIANHPLEEVQGNSLEESKIKAAQELIKSSKKISADIDLYLGQTKEDTFDELKEYVGAEGKYVSITKSVTIYYPKEYLKGVEIVDTPGFNDPIVSREERTKSFLKKADVVIMMLYAGRPFDATDRDILFQNIRQCGIGKVIIAINKYDIPYNEGDDIETIKNYVKEEIKKACKTCNDNTLKEILDEAEPIPLSAEMALLAKLSMSKISADESLYFAWNRACNNFEISNQKQMLEISLFSNLISAIKQMIETEKGKILFAKPLNSILAAGNQKLEGIKKLHVECSSLISNLNAPDDELKEREEKLAKAKCKLERKIKNLEGDFEEIFKDIIRKGKYELEDQVDATCRKMIKIIEHCSKYKGLNSIIPNLEYEMQVLIERTLKRKVEDLSDKTKNKIQQEMREFFEKAGIILRKYLPDDFETEDFIKEIRHNIQLDIQNENVFKYSGKTDDNSDGISNFMRDVFSKITLGIGGKVLDFFNFNNDKEDLLKETIDKTKSNFTPEPFLESILLNKNRIIDMVKVKLITELINPMQRQIEDIICRTSDKEKRLDNAKKELKILIEQENKIKEQIEEINEMK